MKFLRLPALLILLIPSLFVSCKQKAPGPVIGYVQITPDPVLDAARDALFKALADSGFRDGQTATIINKNAQGDLSMLPMILQSFVSDGVDIIVTNGTPTMLAAAQTVKEIPVVFTVAFGPEQVKLEQAPPNLYGVYDPLKAPETVDIILQCVPGLKTLGLPYNNSEPNAAYSSRVFGDEFNKRGIRVAGTPVTSTNDIQMAGQYLVEDGAQALLVTADNTLYLGLNTLAAVADKAGIPLFVTDPMQTGKGAALGYGVDYEKWGYKSGLIAVELLKKRPVTGDKIVPIEDYNLIINKKAAAAQKLVIPQELLDKATKVIE